ncbi:variable surface protein Vir12-like [Plasmodium vivax]|uniref:Variable surface protein Vir12-like n=1 Tax=Plasmodium vivax (strain Salvador I) TaxID=126793 RepID=A5KD07_PLAVS|nr:variable surface protein Vir12-like [Plasmodium vivax]EDL42761.1 variable surface protein Vir12-like [Plasmodium vivax]|eukprot:XP_001612554.1 variable surface protein Vir12-like [Plasmodium vivax Sal-1]
MALSEANNWEKHLPDLPSYKKYTELDNVVISGDGNKYCKENLGSTDEVDKTFCNKIAKNLSILKDENDKQKRKYGCYYFNHWLYDNIGKKYYKGNAKGEKDNVSQNLFNFASLAILQHIKVSSCNGNTFGNPEGWKEEKDLHDYFENYEKIKCNDSDKSKCEKYVNYVTYIKTLYDTKVENCCEDDELDEEGFCESYFKCENMYNPKNLLIKLQKELQSLGKEPEVPREGGAVEVRKAPGSGGEERVKKAKEDEVAAVTTGKETKEKLVATEVPKEKAADSAAQSAPEKNVVVKQTVPESVGSKPGGLESREEKAALEKNVGEKPPAEKPVAAKPETVNPATAESQVAKPVAAKPAAIKPPVAGPVVAESERAKPVAATPLAVKPKEKVSEDESTKNEATEEEANEEETAEGLTVEEVTTEAAVTEMTSTMQHEEALGTHPVESVEQGVRAISSHNTEHASNAIPLTITDSTNTLGTTHEELDSNFFRNVIMAIAVLGTIFFLFYYNRSSRLESSYRKKKKKKGKIFEHNYYEEYEKELTMYGSEETFLDSETDRLYLNYHPDQDSYY